MDLTIKITGTKPLLMHNGRLANPLNKWTRQIASISKKRNKTDDDLMQLMLIEARGGAYETEDGLLGMSVENVWRCIYDAAKAYKLGEDVKRALMHDASTVTLLVSGKKVKADEFCRDVENIDYRPVKIQRNKTMRARTIVRDWSCSATFTLLEDVLQPERLVPVLHRAGLLVGLGDWRPTFGTFEAETI